MNKLGASATPLLTPSWLSGLIIVVVSLAAVSGLVVSLNYQGSTLRYLRDSQATQPHAINANYQTLDNKFSRSVLLSDLPLLIFWGGVGAIAYLFTINLVGTYKKVSHFNEELSYVHANRNEMLLLAAKRMAIRLLALLAWIAFIKITTRVLLPYITALAYAGSGIGNLFQAAAYLVLAVGISIITLHLHVILFRLVLLKPRAFSSNSYS